MSDTFSVSYVVPYDAKKNKWQQSKGGATRPRVLHNYRAFDATDDEKQWAEADKHAMHVASHQAAYVNFQHLLWALSAGQRITDECELVRYACCHSSRESLSLLLFCTEPPSTACAQRALHVVPVRRPLQARVQVCQRHAQHERHAHRRRVPHGRLVRELSLHTRSHVPHSLLHVLPCARSIRGETIAKLFEM